LAEEGLARELVNRIQNFRKDNNLDVVDRIKIQLQYHLELEIMLQNFKAYICSETLCDSLELVDSLSDANKTQLDLIEGLCVDAVIVESEC